ncbi:MAG: hypothetical protein U1E66_08575 [Rhodospirillales bacterium]
MLSGMQVLGDIDDILGQTRQQTTDADSKIAALNDRLLRLRREKADSYQAIARIRLASGNKDELIARLTAVDDNVRTVLDARSTTSTAIDAEIADQETDTARLRAEREKATALVAERQRALETSEAAIRQRLEGSPEYQRQQAAAAAAAQVAAQAREKTEQAKADRASKGEPYESDPLFQYLWRRGFGTAAYTGGLLTRPLDRWVARMIGFDKARADYAMLREIPERLARHTERVEAAAADEAARLKAMQEAAMAEPEPSALRDEVAKAEAAVDKLDDAIEAKGKTLVDAIGRRTMIVRGEDPRTQAAVRVIEEALRDQTLQTLWAAAAATPTADDDHAVARLEQIDDEEAEVSRALEEANRARQALDERLKQIGSVRRDYRRRGYNRGMFDAAGGAFVGSILGELLRGALSRDGFWDQMNRHQVPRPGPGGWGGGWSGGGGRWSGGGGGGGGGDFGGGDFRTGGGF